MAIRWGNGVQLAAELGITKQGVRKAEKAGRIARAANGLFDLDAARIQFRIHTDPEQQLRAMQQRSDRASGADQAVVVPPDIRPLEFAGDAQALVAAKARREGAEADLAELELAEKRGLIMAVLDHRKILFEFARRVRDSILQVPSRAAPLVAAESDQRACQRIIEAEIRAVLQQLSQVEPPAEASGAQLQ
jgi:hypothetical protein